MFPEGYVHPWETAHSPRVLQTLVAHFLRFFFFNTTTFHKLQRNRKSENDSYTMARVGNRTHAKTFGYREVSNESRNEH